MPRYISTYSKATPMLKRAENDAFSNLQQKFSSRSHQTLHRSTRALDLIPEDDIDNQTKEMATTIRSRAWKQKPMHKAVTSTRKPTPLRIAVQKIPEASFSPMFTSPAIIEDEDDETILYLTDSSDDGSTLSEEEAAMTTTHASADYSTHYSDVEVPRDLPDTKKTKSKTSEILKLSSLHPFTSKPKCRVNKKTMKPANSTLLEGQLSSMNIDNYGISDISGDGGEFLASDFSPSLLGKKLSLGSSPGVKKSTSRLVSVHKEGEKKRQKVPLPMQSPCTQVKSVYSFNSSEDTTLPSPPSSHLGKPSLSVTGNKVGIVKKSSSTDNFVKPSNYSSTQMAKKQVSFLLGTKPDVFDPSDPSIASPTTVSLPNLSPSSSILKKKTTDNIPVKASRVTSTPQKSTRNSKAQGCHIMDLSFDISAVSLPSDNDLVVAVEHENHENKENMDALQAGASQSEMGEMTEQLLDFEPMCLEVSQNLGSCLDSTPEKGRGIEGRSEATPSSQVKRRSPDAEKPTKLAKKSKVQKQGKTAWSRNRRRLEYEEHTLSEGTVPECVITKAPFTGYRKALHTSSQWNTFPKGTGDPTVSISQGPMRGKRPKDFQQDVLETIPESLFSHLALAVGCPT